MAGPSLSFSRTLGLVTVGFAAFAPGGGFTTDQQALTGMGRSKQESVTKILALAALEYAVLAPLAWVCSLLLLNAPDASPSLTLPWAVGVPRAQLSPWPRYGCTAGSMFGGGRRG